MAEMKNQDNDNNDDKTYLKRETFAYYPHIENPKHKKLFWDHENMIKPETQEQQKWLDKASFIPYEICMLFSFETDAGETEWRWMLGEVEISIPEHNRVIVWFYHDKDTLVINLEDEKKNIYIIKDSCEFFGCEPKDDEYVIQKTIEIGGNEARSADVDTALESFLKTIKKSSDNNDDDEKTK